MGTAKPTLDTSLFNCSDPAHAFELGKVEGQTLIVDALREALRHGPDALEGAVSIIIDSHDKLVIDINATAKRIKREG